MMKKKAWSSMVLALFLLIPVLCNAQNLKREKPNMVFILVDDLGWADLGCYGNRSIETPAIEFIASNMDQPFFCYVGHHIPHIPLIAREELNKKYEKKWKQQQVNIHPHYAAMCEVMDESVSLILETLDQLELSKNTMVVFFSDNGGVLHCFADGKGEQITDGVSLLPLFTGTGQLESREIFSYFPDYHHDFPGVAVRKGDYKLFKASEDGHLELYNLANDPGERKNLAASFPEKAEELHGILMDWQENVGGRSVTPNPDYDPLKEHILDPEEEERRRAYLPVSLSR